MIQHKKRELIVILIFLGVLTICAPSNAMPQTDLFWNDKFETIHNDREACWETVIANNPEKLDLVKRIAAIIHKYKLWWDRGAWIECGKRIKNESKSRRRAFSYAWHIVNESEKVSDENYTLIPWSLVALYAKESVFDVCALGPKPRRWAYRRGLVKKRYILSHYREDVEKIVEEGKRVFKRTGVDLGPCQLLSKYYDGNPLDMMHVKRGSEICAKEAYTRGLRHNVKQPQLLWPNGRKDSKRAKKYRRHVNSRLRRHGVTTFELFNDNLWYKKTG